MTVLVKRSVTVAGIALLVGCSSFGSEPPPPPWVQTPQSEVDADIAPDAQADGAAPGSDASTDSGRDGSAACPGATVLTDGFEGAGWNASAWSSTHFSGSGSFTIDSRHQAGTTSMRFKTALFSDNAFFSKGGLTGKCPITIRTWLYIGATSVCDGTGLLTIKLASGASVGVHLIEGAWIAASNVAPPLGALARQTWTEIVLTYDPTTGAASLRAGTLSRAFNVAPSEPVSLDLGILGAADGGANGDEILFDDVTITR